MASLTATARSSLQISERMLRHLNRRQLWSQPAALMSSKKHYDMKFRKERREKNFFFEWESREQQTPDERRMEAKKLGVQMPRKDRRSSPRMDSSSINIGESGNIYGFTDSQTIGKHCGKRRMEAKKLGVQMPRKERRSSPRMDSSSINIGESVTIMDPYVPHKVKVADMSWKESSKYYVREVPLGKIADFRSRRALKKYEDDYKRKELANECQLLYIKAMNLLTTLDIRKDYAQLFDYMTGYCIRYLTEDFAMRTVQWEFIESVKPPKIVSMRTHEMVLKDNLITQITLEMNSKQKFAVYDQFGRLMYGNPDSTKTVTEYIVFEKHIVDTYGKWRLHGKVKPKGSEPMGTLVKTMKKSDLDEIEKDQKDLESYMDEEFGKKKKTGIL